jgi:hypothetical protein
VLLKAGRKFWALARTGKSAALKGNDVVNGYLLLATSCDGTLATVAMPTTVRVVCNNTLTIALRDGVVPSRCPQHGLMPRRSTPVGRGRGPVGQLYVPHEDAGRAQGQDP